MAQIIPALPGYRNFEYLLVIPPHEELSNRIVKIRQEFSGKYTAPGKITKPHITLAKFVNWSMMEEKIVQRLQVVAMGTAPFKAELKDFGSFPSHTIYINVPGKTPFQNLVKELRQTQRLLKGHPDFNPHFFNDPHIVIATQLKPDQYAKAWAKYEHAHFTARFIADGMLLLKRAVGDKTFQIVKRFEFMNLPVAVKQGELFV